MRSRFAILPLLSSFFMAVAGTASAAGPIRWKTLAEAIVELDKAESDLIEARDLDKRVAGWARYQPDWSKAAGPPEPAALRKLVDGGGDYQAMGLSVLWLAVLDDPQDLDRIGALLESPVQAGALPQVVDQKGAVDTLDVAWRPITLGYAARLAMKRMAGLELGDRRAYARWRRTHPDPTRSLVWWKSRWEGTAEGGRDAVLQDLRTRNPLLFARLVMQVVPPRGELTAAQLRANADASGILEAVLGLQGLTAVLTDRIDWEELKSGDLVLRTKQWVLLQWTRILGTKEARSLAELWYARSSVEPRTVHPEMALALAEVRPDQASEVLQKMLIELPRTEVSAALRHLARCIPVPQAWALHYWFYGPDGPDTDANRLGIMQGLRERGIPGGRDVLRALIKLWSFRTDSPLFVAELVKTARALGCREGFPRLAEIGPVPEPARGAREAEYDKAVALVKKAAAARKDCIVRVRRFLRPDMPP